MWKTAWSKGMATDLWLLGTNAKARLYKSYVQLGAKLIGTYIKNYINGIKNSPTNAKIKGQSKI
jgi:hypothetical protein